MKRYILFGISLLMTFPLSVFAQDYDDEEEEEIEEVQVKRVITAKKQYETRTVKGFVFDAATQQPISGAIVRAAEIEGYSALTDDDGAYELKVPVFASAVHVTSPDHNPIRMGLVEGEQQKPVYMYITNFTAEYNAQTNVRSDYQITDFKYTNAINIKD